MNNLIIIGNGFDLAHNMKTSYKDFIMHIISSHISDQTKYYDLLYIDRKYFISSIEEFYEHLTRVPSNGAIKFRNLFFHSLVLDFALNNWCDIEKKYFFELNLILNDDESIGILNFHDEFNEVRKYLIDYLRDENKDSVKFLNSFFSIFNKLKEENLKILNFNYTKTLNQYISKDTFNKDQIINLHGTIDDKNNPVIFGYAANHEDTRKLIDNGNKEYLKFIKKQLYKRTENENILNDYLQNTKNINLFILGHSCGISDGLILKQIFNHKNIHQIRIFYFEEYENYYDTQFNIERIMNSNSSLEKLITFISSYRTPQLRDSEEQNGMLLNYLNKVIEEYNDEFSQRKPFDPEVF